MKRLLSAIGAAFLLTGVALFVSQSAIAQVPAKPDNPLPSLLGGIEWDSWIGTVGIQYATEHESFVVTVGPITSGNACSRESSASRSSYEQLLKVNSGRLTIVAEQLKAWVLTDDGGALVRSKGQDLQPVVPALNDCNIIGSVSFAFRWTPSMRVSAVVLKAGDRSKLFSMTAN